MDLENEIRKLKIIELTNSHMLLGICAYLIGSLSEKSLKDTYDIAIENVKHFLKEEVI